MSLCLLRADGSKYLEVMLDPATNKMGDVWHIQLARLKVRRVSGCIAQDFCGLSSKACPFSMP
jgi:hypothetical protein